MLGRLIGGALDLVDMRVPNVDTKTLQEKIKSSQSPIVEHNFGRALGSMYFIKAHPSIDFAKLLDDVYKQQSEPRKTRSSHAWLTGGPIVTSRSGADGLRHHFLFVRSMSQSKNYTHFTLEALDHLNIQDGQTITFRTLTTNPIYNILAKGMLGIDELPADLSAAFQQFSTLLSGEDTSNETGDEKLDVPVSTELSDYAKNNFNFLRGTYYAYLLGTQPEFRKARDAYITAAKKLVKDQKELIKKHIQYYADGGDTTNILALSVIELLKEKLEETFGKTVERDLLNSYLIEMLNEDDNTLFANLLKDDYLHTIPANIMAALNVRGVIPAMLHALASKPELLAELRGYLAAQKLNADFANMHELLIADKNQNGVLNQIYLEGLRLRGFNEPLEELNFGTIFRYYLDKPLTVGDTVIPAKSVICILNGMKFADPKIWGDHPEKFDSHRFFCAPEKFAERTKIVNTAFSHQPRVCPGKTIAEFICKAFVAKLAMEHDLTLIARPGESSITKAKLQFTARLPEVKLEEVMVEEEKEVKSLGMK